jgi:hypothetical protein
VTEVPTPPGDLRDEIIVEARRMLDDIMALTEARVAELVRAFGEVYRQRIAEIDEVMSKLPRRRGDEGLPSVH